MKMRLSSEKRYNPKPSCAKYFYSICKEVDNMAKNKARQENKDMNSPQNKDMNTPNPSTVAGTSKNAPAAK